MTLQRDLDNLRRQAVAIFEAIRHQIIDMGCAQQAQAQHAHRTGRGTIGIEVANNQNTLTLSQGLNQQIHRRINALELLKRQQACQTFVQFFG
ncbi:hypothetical protein D3C84_1070660 [compost metagenome]